MALVKKIIVLTISLAIAAGCVMPQACADDQSGRTITVTYTVSPDENFGTPQIINPPQSHKQIAGVEFLLAEDLQTDSTLAVNKLDNETYVGNWEFSGWTASDDVTIKKETEAEHATGASSAEQSGQNKETEKKVEPSSAPTETGTASGTATEESEEAEKTDELTDVAADMVEEAVMKYYCISYRDVEAKGQWTFVPTEKVRVQDISNKNTELPLSGSSGSITSFWPQRETDLNKVFSTGLFSKSLIKYMDENISDVSVQNGEFVSVALTDAELSHLVSAAGDSYYALTSENEHSEETRTGIAAIMSETGEETAGTETAFVVYCAENAGLLDGIGRSMLRTADINQEYEFLKNTACADFIGADEILGMLGTESTDSADNIIFNDNVIDVAQSVGWYDASGAKDTIKPGNLIIFKDKQGSLVSIGIIDSVEDESLSYVACPAGGTPVEYTLCSEDIAALDDGTELEIVRLRSCSSMRIVYEFLLNELGLPEASAIAVMGNMYYESEFSTKALGDGYTSFGLCQWHNERFMNLVVFCMKNNYNIASLEGQLRYLAYELSTEYVNLLKELKGGKDNTTWVKEAAYSFCKEYEDPADLEITAALREKMAAGPLWKCFKALSEDKSKLQNLNLSAEVPNTGEQTNYINYTVQSGDTMASICQKLGIDYDTYRSEIMALNGIENDYTIYKGQMLVFWRSMKSN